jgi:hypothetical protein
MTHLQTESAPPLSEFTTGLTPPGVSTTEVLRAIIPDIIAGTVGGFRTLEANGKEVVVFFWTYLDLYVIRRQSVMSWTFEGTSRWRPVRGDRSLRMSMNCTGAVYVNSLLL